MSGIFITYRREDSQGFAGRLDDDLTERFGDDLIFRDREIAPGDRFGERLLEQLRAADVAVVVIGPRWIDVRDADGARRLDQTGDWVRREIEAALERGIPVVPVLVGGARMPGREQLPETLAELSQRQAYPLSDLRWHAEVDELAVQLARFSPALLRVVRRRGVTRSRGDAAEAIRDVGTRVIDEAMRRSQAARRPAAHRSRPLLAAIGRKLRKLLTTAVALAIAYIVIRRAGGPELNALLDEFIAFVTEIVGRVF